MNCTETLQRRDRFSCSNCIDFVVCDRGFILTADDETSLVLKRSVQCC